MGKVRHTVYAKFILSALCLLCLITVNTASSGPLISLHNVTYQAVIDLASTNHGGSGFAFHKHNQRFILHQLWR